MSGRNIEDFLEDSAAFDALSDEDKALLMSGGVIEGETEAGKAEDNGASPAAVSVEGANEDTPPAANTPEPVVMARDGQHTIPFSELETARARAQQLEQELVAIKSSKPADQQPAQDGKQTDVPLPVVAVDDRFVALVEERDNALFAGDTERAKELGLKIIGIQNEIATNAAIKHMDDKAAANKEQMDQQSAYDLGLQKANELAAKFDFLNPQSPNANPDAIELVVAQRDKLMDQGETFADAIDKAVAKVAPLFAKAITAQPGADVAAKAAEAISKARSQVPTSLSQAPAGSAAHHDEGEAIRAKDGLSLMSSFDGKSSEDILKLMSRVI